MHLVFVSEAVTYQAEADSAGEAQILSIALDFGVREEEGHSHESTDDHRATSAPEELRATHVACQDWTWDRAQIGEGVVAPDLTIGKTTELGTASANVDREEDVV